MRLFFGRIRRAVREGAIVVLLCYVGLLAFCFFWLSALNEAVHALGHVEYTLSPMAQVLDDETPLPFILPPMLVALVEVARRIWPAPAGPEGRLLLLHLSGAAAFAGAGVYGLAVAAVDVSHVEALFQFGPLGLHFPLVAGLGVALLVAGALMWIAGRKRRPVLAGVAAMVGLVVATVILWWAGDDFCDEVFLPRVFNHRTMDALGLLVLECGILGVSWLLAGAMGRWNSLCLVGALLAWSVAAKAAVAAQGSSHHMCLRDTYRNAQMVAAVAAGLVLLACVLAARLLRSRRHNRAVG